MDVEETEIAVIGAGPSGLIAAREVSQMGLKVMVLEEHSEIGLPCHCAGLLSINGLSRIGVPCRGAYVLNMIRGARFFSPSNIPLAVEWEEPLACVVNRHLFDLFLAEQAYKSGSLIKLKSRVNRVKKDGGEWLLEIGGRSRVRAKLLIDAEGAVPKIPRMVGIKTHNAKKLLKGMQVDIRVSDLNPDYVEVHLGRKLAPGFFAWVIPLNDEVARVGLACNTSDVRSRLLKFIEKRFRAASYNKLEPLKYYSGLVITCGPIKRTYGDGILVVGDSAGHTKPITGGGVIFGGMCARIAGMVASRAIIDNRIEGGFIKKYEEEWRSRIGKELKIALLIRKILNNIPDRDLDKIFSVAVKEGVHNEIVAGECDMDYQATTIIKTLKGRILRFMPIIFKIFLCNIIGGTTKIYK